MSTAAALKKRPTIDPDAFRSYSESGWQSIPLHRPGDVSKDKKGRVRKDGKRPIHPNWTVRTYDSAAVIARCAKEVRNMGARPTAKQLVIDVDPRNAGTEGFAKLCKDKGLEPSDYPTVITGSGGFHHYMTLPEGVRVVDTLKNYPGVEFKSVGRQVVAAGSVHPDTGKQYEWDAFTPPLADAPEAPAALIEAITRPERTGEAIGGGQATQEKIANALSYLNAEDYRDHADWLRLMMACHHASNGDARTEFVDWSTSDPQYANFAEDIGRRWDSLHTERPGGEEVATYKTLNYELRERGSAGAADAQIRDTGDAAADFEGEPIEDFTADAAERPAIDFPPFEWTPLEELPQRQYVFAPAYERGYVTLTVAAGGAGKSALVRVECIEMASGMALLGDTAPPRRARVGYWDGEDDTDEDKRAFGAIVRHYELDGPDVYKFLHVVSGRDMPIKIATMRKGDFKIAAPVVDEIIAAIRARKLDVLIIDPFVSSHSVSENDNVMMDAVVKTWARITYETGCVIHLVHHTRKVNGEAASIESSRGASAMNYAARVRRVINRMTIKQASAAGLTDEERRRHFSLDYESSSHIPAGEALKWYRFESVELPNGPKGKGTRMGVVVAAEVSAIPTMSEHDVREVFDLIRAGGPWREGAKAGKAWIGHPIAETCGLDPEADRKRINALIKSWLTKGFLTKQTGKDAHRKTRTFIVAGDFDAIEEDECDFG